ncbi:MAG: hypothetical protein JOZ54_09410 [Acidobacteria bacterium]|nr:hypothetical protein [Acidobacteriota bacterium]
MALVLSLLLVAPLFAADPQTKISYTDPAGDVTGADDDPHPADVTALNLTSDGQYVIVELTLAAVPKPTSVFQSLLLGVAFDVDKNAKTGGPGFGGMHGDVPGIDFESEVFASFEDGAISKTAAASLFSVKANGNQSSILGSTDAVSTPAKGKTYTAKVAYKDLGVKAGQTIRIFARELNDRGAQDGVFPAALLTLK